MRSWAILLAFALALAGCKPENAHVEVRPVRTVVVDPKPVHDDRQAVGEVKPRYESDLSFRVAGKVLARRVDVGATVKQGDTLASLDTQDYQNRLRSAEADVSACRGRARRGAGDRGALGKLLKNGWTPQANYDTALRNLRSAEAKLASAKATLDLTRDQLSYTELKADFDGVITAVGAEAGPECQRRPDGGEARPTGRQGRRVQHRRDRVRRSPHRGRRGHRLAALQPAADRSKEWYARSLRSPTPTTRTYTVKVTLKNPPPQMRFGMSIGGRWKGSSAPVVALPLSALFEKNGTPAVWVVRSALRQRRAEAGHRRALRDRQRRHRQRACQGRHRRHRRRQHAARRSEGAPCRGRLQAGASTNEELQPVPLGARAQEPRRLPHAGHRARRHPAISQARPRGGPALHHQDHGGEDAVARRHHARDRAAGHRPHREEARGAAEPRLSEELHQARRVRGVREPQGLRRARPMCRISGIRRARRSATSSRPCRRACRGRSSTTSSATPIRSSSR